MIKNKAIQNLIRTGLLEDKKIFITNKKYNRFLRPRKGFYDMKPIGLWYAIGSSWIDWCIGEEYGGIGIYIYEVELNSNANILFLDNKEDIFTISKKYKRKDEYFKYSHFNYINWKEIMSDYDGIEVSPYFYDLRLAFDLIWYSFWDVSSGCIWKANAKKKITLLAEYKEKRKEFVIL